jgi:hypothetical protein
MRSPALAIGWEFRQRHRWGLTAVAGYLLVVAMIKLFILEPGQIVELEDVHSFAAVVIVPLAALFTYFLAVFSFGLSGDLAGRQSIYPTRLFTLPVTSAALAGWPMFYGAVAVAILWLATRLLAVWPSWMQVPVIWPALLAASLLAWTQTLVWMPYGLPGLRVIVATLWLTTIDAVVMVAVYFKISEPIMVAFLAPHVPLAFLAARYAVGRARRGDVPDWRGTFTRLGQLADVLPRRRGIFHSSAVRAGSARRRPRHAGTRLSDVVHSAVHSTVHGRYRRRNGEQTESGCARFLRRNAVYRNAAVVRRRAHRGQD